MPCSPLILLLTDDSVSIGDNLFGARYRILRGLMGLPDRHRLASVFHSSDFADGVVSKASWSSACSLPYQGKPCAIALPCFNGVIASFSLFDRSPYLVFAPWSYRCHRVPLLLCLRPVLLSRLLRSFHGVPTTHIIILVFITFLPFFSFSKAVSYLTKKSENAREFISYIKRYSK